MIDWPTLFYKSLGMLWRPRRRHVCMNLGMRLHLQRRLVYMNLDKL